MAEQELSAPGAVDVPEVVRSIVRRFAALPQVQAMALGGSRTSQSQDQRSDFDLYVYTGEEIPLAIRRAIAEELARPGCRIEINNQFWGPGDEWEATRYAPGTGIDLMYFDPRWMQEQVDKVLVRHEASIGYSTCFWYTVRNSGVLYDPTGWFQSLQEQATGPYPEPLRQAIIAKNYPILHTILASYTHQIELAVARGDLVSVNHRLAALFASYFDILFALNRQPHPGEKRLPALAHKLCAKLPAGMDADVNGILSSDFRDAGSLLPTLQHLLARLDDVLVADGGILAP